jgi:hypothetical protein
MSLKLNSSGGGSVTLQEPVTASTLTLNLPATSGTMVLDGGSPTFATVTSTALTVNGNNISAVNSMGFRNRIINGDMRIDQRNAGASVSISGVVNTYTLDRWVIRNDADGVVSVQQSSTAPTGFNNSLLYTVTTADASLGATQNYSVQQRVEGFNMADFGWGTASAQTVTLSFWVRSSLTGTFGGSISNSAANRSYPFTYTISAANTWEQKTVTIAGDTTGTWLTTNGVGAYIYLSTGAGSTISGTAGAWAASDFRSATGATSVVSTNGATFYITGVQLEAGTVATPFERRPIGTELSLCQRYYEGISSLQYRAIAAASYAGSQNFSFLNEKRAAPTITIFGLGGTTGSYDRDGVGNTAVTSTSYTHGFRLNLSAGQSGGFGMTASAEL